jgi:peptidoglycan biosynthesis protein MviN/MurJ (putative lipid II flippase)
MIGLVFNLGLNSILLPHYQQVGAAIATSLTEMLLCCIGLVVIPRQLRPLGSLAVACKVIISSLVMALIILLLHTLQIFVILPIAILIYLGLSLLLGTIPRKDYLAVYRAMRQKV